VAVQAVFPQTLKEITAVDQVWATDITDIPLQKGFLLLVAIVGLLFRTMYSCGEGFAYLCHESNVLYEH